MPVSRPALFRSIPFRCRRALLRLTDISERLKVG